MMIWKVSQSINNNYDTYDSAVVIAASPEAARLMHPRSPSVVWREVDGEHAWSTQTFGGVWLNNRDDSWARPDAVQVELIGVATGEAEPGVVCASYNAG